MQEKNFSLIFLLAFRSTAGVSQENVLVIWYRLAVMEMGVGLGSSLVLITPFLQASIFTLRIQVRDRQQFVIF